MIVNTVNLSTGNKVLLIEDFFDKDLLERVLQLCDEHNTDSDWTNAEWTQLRKIYKGNSKTYIDLLAALGSAEIREPIEKQLGHSIKFTEANLWADYPGFGPLAAHVEQNGTGQAQVFLTRKELPTNGTSIMNIDKQLLFTMPYRNNFGWYFDECTKIMHSREFDVPAGMVRYSLIFWYSYD